MTKEEYWGGLQETGASQADLTINKITPVQVTQVRACLHFVNNHPDDVLMTAINVHKVAQARLLLAQRKHAFKLK